MKFKMGKRVIDDFLGPGEISEIHKDEQGQLWACSVLFDKRPPIEYNMGSNPALVHLNYLKPEPPKEKP